ncbi:MAG: hypothetical protein HY319_02740 [Armatimonadetes bacterium]|nr:hypothetical protein [Armatimonadota bacterium]
MADDITERAARLNTQLRFGKHREALLEAYKLRIHLQTCGQQGPQIDQELESVEQVIEKLERRKSGRVQRTMMMFAKAVVEAFDRSSGEGPRAGEDAPPPREAQSESVPNE